MRGRRLVPLLCVLALVGCGSSSNDSAKLAGLIRATGAARLHPSGRPQVKSATCRRSGNHYSCRMTYEFTASNGQRSELQETVDGSCSKSCSVNWATAGGARVVRDLGLDSSSPVAKCQKALKAATAGVGSADEGSLQAQAQAACQGVHGGGD
jgi:hypothetical protein